MFGWSGGIGCIAVTGAVWLVLVQDQHRGAKAYRVLIWTGAE